MEFRIIIIIQLLYYLFFQGIQFLRLVAVKIPKYAMLHQDARLECRYKLNNESYTLTWYKDNEELFSFFPRVNKFSPRVRVVERPGITVNMPSSRKGTLVLSKVTFSSSGQYKCEITSAFSWQSTKVTDHGNMTVVVIPEKGPNIIGHKFKYQIGDTVHLNCSSQRSHPPTQLRWFINEEEADPAFLDHPEQFNSGYKLYVTHLGLKFKVDAQHFKDEYMNLRCVAQILDLYWKTVEITVKKGKPLIFKSSQLYLNKSQTNGFKDCSTRLKTNHFCLLILVICKLFISFLTDTLLL